MVSLPCVNCSYYLIISNYLAMASIYIRHFPDHLKLVSTFLYVRAIPILKPWTVPAWERSLGWFNTMLDQHSNTFWCALKQIEKDKKGIQKNMICQKGMSLNVQFHCHFLAWGYIPTTVFPWTLSQCFKSEMFNAPPYSPNLAPCEYYHFMKKRLASWSFYDYKWQSTVVRWFISQVAQIYSQKLVKHYDKWQKTAK